MRMRNTIVGLSGLIVVVLLTGCAGLGIHPIREYDSDAWVQIIFGKNVVSVDLPRDGVIYDRGCPAYEKRLCTRYLDLTSGSFPISHIQVFWWKDEGVYDRTPRTVVRQCVRRVYVNSVLYSRELRTWDEECQEWIVFEVMTYQDRGAWGENAKVNERMTKDEKVFERIANSVQVWGGSGWIRPKMIELQDREIVVQKPKQTNAEPRGRDLKR